MKGLLVAAAAALALLSAPAALAGPSLHVGAVEDSAIWGNPYAQMDLARLAGFDSVRMTVQWTDGHDAPANAHMALIRAASDAARARGIEPILAIYNADHRSTPAWDAQRALFTRFVRNVVLAAPAVSTFVIGDEPNSGVYWRPQFGSDGGDAAAPAYERLLADSYDAIKAVRPDATVVGGALHPRGSDDPEAARESHSPTEFIRDLGAAYRASGRTAPLMDVWDQHAYADTSALPPSMPHADSTSIALADYRKLVALLGEAFDGTAQRGSTLPILYGEYGVETAIPPGEARVYHGTQPPAAPAVDEATQAAYVTQALKLALCQPNVVGILLFHVVDESDLGGWQSGPFYADGTPKSSEPAIAAAAAAARAGTLASCPDDAAPSLRIGTPAPDGTVTVAASDDVGVGRVQLRVNGRPAGTRYAAPYVFSWRPPAPGAYTFTAVATDGSGNTASASLGLAAVPPRRGGAAGGSSAGWTYGQLPANDRVGSARRIAGLRGHARGSTAFATRQRGEPFAAVWYAWRAPAAGRLRLSAGGRARVLVDGRAARGGVRVERRRVYRIAVAGGRTRFALRWRLTRL